MFDGIKFDCPTTGFEQWRHCDELPEFPTLVSERTGEILRRPVFVKHRGLIFKLTPSAKKQHNFKCSVEGSLHKFANAGSHNADAFTFDRVRHVIGELQNAYHIHPASCPIRNLEIGLNFRLPIEASQFVSDSISLADRAFAEFDPENIYLGKEAVKAQYSLKIYDKGRQLTGAPSDLLRVEMKIRKMQFLSDYGITTLADLTDADKSRALGRLLFDAMSEVIFYDHTIRPAELTEREKTQLANYSNPYFWHKDSGMIQNLSRLQRHRERKRFSEMVERFGCNQIFQAVLDAILPTWEGLISPTKSASKNSKNVPPLIEGKCNVFTVKIKGKIVSLTAAHFSSENEKSKCAEKRENRNEENGKKDVSKFCRICGNDISFQRGGSLTCSRQVAHATGGKCKYHFDDARRRKMRDAKREQEAHRLASFLSGKVLETLAFQLVVLLTTGRTWEGTAKELTKKSEIKIQQVAAIEVRQRNDSFRVSTRRAKALVRALRNATPQEKGNSKKEKRVSEFCRLSPIEEAKSRSLGKTCRRKSETFLPT